MTYGKLILAFLLAFNLTACNAHGGKNIGPVEFEKGLTAGGAQLVDVRTPEEYNEKHLPNAQLISINDDKFEEKMQKLDKNKPVYFYCLSGARSGNAVAWAQKNGFAEAYNLEGGIMAWMNANKPVETSRAEKTQSGLSFDQYLQDIKKDKLVLVDFTAVWCGPCKMLKPAIKNVTKKHGDKVELLEIDVDKNPAVANKMNVTGIPLLILYNNGKEVWRMLGLTDEETITQQVLKFGKAAETH